MQGSGLLRTLSRFERKRVMDERHHAVTFPQHLRHFGKSSKRKAVDDNEALPGKRRKLRRGEGARCRRGPRKVAAQVDETNLPAEVGKLRDHPAVVAVAAGRSRKVARYGDGHLAYHNGASYQARASGDSAMVTRIAASSRPSRPSRPARAASASRSKTYLVRNSVVVFTPANCGSSSRL